MSRLIVAVVPVALIVVIAIGGLGAARRRGYRLGPDTIVRCGDGHLFTTVWMPGASLKSIRLGFTRYQYCPVGDHWAFVRPVRDDELTAAEREVARQVRDGPVP